MYADDFCSDIVAYCKKYRFDAIHPHHQNVSSELVKRCHQSGILVNVWTVDSPADLLRMMECGVDTVITNDVETAIKIVNQ